MGVSFARVRFGGMSDSLLSESNFGRSCAGRIIFLVSHTERTIQKGGLTTHFCRISLRAA